MAQERPEDVGKDENRTTFPVEWRAIQDSDVFDGNLRAENVQTLLSGKG